MRFIFGEEVWSSDCWRQVGVSVGDMPCGCYRRRNRHKDLYLERNTQDGFGRIHTLILNYISMSDVRKVSKSRVNCKSVSIKQSDFCCLNDIICIILNLSGWDKKLLKLNGISS